MKSFLSCVACLLLSLAALPALAQSEVDSDEVFRRGDSIEYVDGIQGNGLRADITREHSDSEKFFITVLYRDGDGRVEALKDEWSRSRELRSFAIPDKPQASWAHLRFYNVDDPTQAGRWKDIRVVSTPTILIQPCRSGTWGDPSTVIFQTVVRLGQPKELANRMAYSLQLYASKLKERPRGTEGAERVIGGGIGAVESMTPAVARYGQATTIDDESNVSLPWRRQQSRPVEIPPFPQSQAYDPSYEDCPGPGPCPLPRPRPQPERDPDVDRKPWFPRPNQPVQPYIDPTEIPPGRPHLLNPFSWVWYIIGGIVASIVGLICSTVTIVLLIFGFIWLVRSLYGVLTKKDAPAAAPVVVYQQPAYQQPAQPVPAQVMPNYPQPNYPPSPNPPRA